MYVHASSCKKMLIKSSKIMVHISFQKGYFNESVLMFNLSTMSFLYQQFCLKPVIYFLANSNIAF